MKGGPGRSEQKRENEIDIVFVDKAEGVGCRLENTKIIFYAVLGNSNQLDAFGVIIISFSTNNKAEMNQRIFR